MTSPIALSEQAIRALGWLLTEGHGVATVNEAALATSAEPELVRGDFAELVDAGLAEWVIDDRKIRATVRQAQELDA